MWRFLLGVASGIAGVLAYNAYREYEKECGETDLDSCDDYKILHLKDEEDLETFGRDSSEVNKALDFQNLNTH